jgi:hypothetical protein
MLLLMCYQPNRILFMGRMEYKAWLNDNEN